MKKFIGDTVWIALLAAIVLFLVIDESRLIFLHLTKNYALLMGFVKFAILASMGELLGRRINDGKWTILGIHLHERALMWGVLGALFTFIFPIYSAGVDFLIKAGRLPLPPFISGDVIVAFWKSFWINILFAFPMMSFHRMTDTLIDKRKLFAKWPWVETWNSVDWQNMWKVVAPTVLWFWIPAHTLTFSLSSEYRIIMAAGLSICLGGILAFAKKK